MQIQVRSLKSILKGENHDWIITEENYKKLRSDKKAIKMVKFVKNDQNIIYCWIIAKDAP